MPDEHMDVSDQAATHQGLRPAMKLLRREHIPYMLRDTGGSTMKVAVYYTADFSGPALVIDRADESDYTSEDGWNVMLDPGDLDSEWEDVAIEQTGAELVALIRARIPAALLNAQRHAHDAQEDARRAEISRQGLDPLWARLEQEDIERERRGTPVIPWSIDDNTPLIIFWVHLPNNTLLGITRTEVAEVDESSPDGWWVCHYTSLDAYMLGEATSLDENATADRVVSLINEHLAPRH